MNLSNVKIFYLIIIIKICVAKKYYTIDINAVNKKNGYYYLNTFIGTPPQKQSLIIDTGSSQISTSCSTCYNCATHEYPQFNLSKSKSGSWCNGEELGVDFCKYTHQFGEGSIISGRYFSDILTFNSSKKNHISKGSIFSVKYNLIGCNEFETKNFLRQSANGIIGIGPKKNIYGYNIATTMLESASKTLKISNENVIISLCLLRDGGTLNIGEMNNDIIEGQEKNVSKKSSIYWIPLVTPSNLYSVLLEQILLLNENADKMYKISAIIDIGSTFTYFPKKIFDLIMSKFSKICNKANNIELDVCVVSNNSFCWRDLSKIEDLFPIIKVKFKGQDQLIYWKYQSYLYSNGENLWCLGIREQNVVQTDAIIFGISFLINRQIILDPLKKRIGFNEAFIKQCNGRNYLMS